MPTLIFRFPAGRYHATPWGHHVNEGLIEWPPSPWRLLRTLLATGYAMLHWPTAGPPPEARSLVEKLASVLPYYRLPKATGTHSRHYMPMARFKNGREETSLVFDTWARVSGELAVNWQVELTAQEHELLERLAERIGYLGRSESWVVAHLATDARPFPAGEACWPEGNGEASPGPGWEQISVLVPEPADTYAAWRERAVARTLERPEQIPAGRKLTAKMKMEQEKAIRPYPPDLIACLQMQTNELQGFGWSQPPGSRRVLYWRRTDALETGAPRHRYAPATPAVEAMLLSMTTQGGNEHALPPVTRTLAQAEHLHRQLVGSLKGRHHPALTGCDEQRRPLSEPHRHAHLLPIDLNGDGHLDHILIWAPMGLDGEAQSTIRRLRSTFAKGVMGPLHLAVAASAHEIVDLTALAGVTGDRIRRHIGKGREWISATPFVPPRHIKKHGSNTLEGQIHAELASRGLPSATTIELLDPHDTELARRQRHFIRCRRFGPAPPIDHSFTLRLIFDAEVQGPISLGYGSHFGLGLFATN